MKKYVFPSLLLMLLSLSLTSCQAIADIFKTGMWFGVIAVLLIVILILWIVSKTRNK